MARVGIRALKNDLIRGRWMLYTHLDHEESDLMLVENFR